MWARGKLVSSIQLNYTSVLIHPFILASHFNFVAGPWHPASSSHHKLECNDSPLLAIWSQCYLLCRLRGPDLACPTTRLGTHRENITIPELVFGTPGESAARLAAGGPITLIPKLALRARRQVNAASSLASRTRTARCDGA